jgi:hypothetical protein
LVTAGEGWLTPPTTAADHHRPHFFRAYPMWGRGLKELTITAVERVSIGDSTGGRTSTMSIALNSIFIPPAFKHPKMRVVRRQ